MRPVAQCDSAEDDGDRWIRPWKERERDGVGYGVVDWMGAEATPWMDKVHLERAKGGAGRRGESKGLTRGEMLRLFGSAVSL